MAGAKDFSLLLFSSVPIGSWAQPASYLVSNGDSFPEVKLQGHEDDHSAPCSAKVKNGGATSPLSHMSSWLGA
jgi:hypothetical protein